MSRTHHYEEAVQHELHRLERHTSAAVVAGGVSGRGRSLVERSGARPHVGEGAHLNVESAKYQQRQTTAALPACVMSSSTGGAGRAATRGRRAFLISCRISLWTKTPSWA